MKKHFLIICYIFIAYASIGQSGKLKKADNYYNKLSYSYALELYEQLLGSELDSPTLKSKIATCCYYIGQMEKAESYFNSMINSELATKEDYFFYSQALKQNGKYSESDLWMLKFNQTAASDERGLSYIKNTTYLDKIEKQGINFEIKNLDCNSDVADFGGYSSISEKEVFFISARKNRIIKYEWSWNRSKYLDLYRSEVDTNRELQKVTILNKRVNSRFHEGPLCFSKDGKYVYFTRNNISKGNQRKDKKGIQNLQLFRAEVDSLGKWHSEIKLPFNSKEYSVGHPTLREDGKVLFFVSDMPGGIGGSDLYKVDVNEDGTFGNIQNLGSKINTEGQEMFPWINNKGELFFASNGHIGLGGLDVFVVSMDINGNFNNVQNVGMPINSKNDDFAFTMNIDNNTGYFSSNRQGGKGDDDIYSYLLISPFQNNLIVEGVVRDEITGEILKGAKVQIYNSKQEVIGTAISDESGAYSFDIEPENDYSISVSGVEKYNEKLTSLTTKNIDPNIRKVNRDVSLIKEENLSLYCIVSDANTSIPLEGVKITIIDNETKSEFINEITPVTGNTEKAILGKKVKDKLSYTIRLEKQGYLTKTVVFNYKIEELGRINVHEKLNMTMDNISIGMDLSSAFEINPIYFDLGKWNIRPDASVELDKIVKIMNDNPNLVIELGSHTDCRSSKDFNQRLSQNRAAASAAYIKARIQNPSRISGKGYGESKLKVNCPCEGKIISNCSEDQHQLNRRTEFIVVSNDFGIKSNEVEVPQKVKENKDPLIVKEVDLSNKKDDNKLDNNNNLINNLSIKCLISDAKTLLPLEGVKIKIINNDNNSVIINEITPVTGNTEKAILDKKIKDKISYTIQLEKEGYVSKTIVFNYTIEELGRINVHEKLNLNMDSISIGMDLATAFKINPIYFDLGKWNIRPDAAVELDKIIKVMNDNPNLVIELGSHTDCRSSKDFNQRLSQNRAASSAEYIKAKITNPNRIYGKGYGESRLKINCPCEGNVISNCSEDQHQLNRRTEFIVLSNNAELSLDKDLVTPKVIDYKNSVSINNSGISNDNNKLNDDQKLNVKNGFYIIQAGETLYRVYVKTGVPIEKLKLINNLKDNNVKLGQKIYLK